MRATLVILLLAAACSRDHAWQRHIDASGDISADVPTDWPSNQDPNLQRRPIASLEFLGEEKPQDEGRPLGSLIRVTRVTRVTSEMPADKRARKKYEENWLGAPGVLFGASIKSLPPAERKKIPTVSDITLGGKPAKTCEIEYEYVNRSLRVWIRAVDIVVRTDKAYYTIEYSAPRDRFEKNRPVFERFLKSFAFGPAA